MSLVYEPCSPQVSPQLSGQSARRRCQGGHGFEGSNNVSHFEVLRETGTALCRIALWDCIREAIASFIGCYEVAQETTSQLPPSKQSNTAIQHNTEPASQPTPKWLMVSMVTFYETRQSQRISIMQIQTLRLDFKVGFILATRSL